MDYIIRYIPLPPRIKGMTVKDSEGFFNIYINQGLSECDRRITAAHELSHISRDDFSSGESIYSVEAPLY